MDKTAVFTGVALLVVGLLAIFVAGYFWTGVFLSVLGVLFGIAGMLDVTEDPFERHPF